jgi:hypothetical protein
MYYFQLKALDQRLIWKLSGILLAHYQIGDEFYIRKILQEVVFNPDYLDPTDSVIWKLRNAEIGQGSCQANREESLDFLQNSASDFL